MRYIPSSRYTLDEIAEQCRAAINRPQNVTQQRTVSYNDILYFYRVEDKQLVAA